MSADIDHKKVLVVGAGAAGLRVALELMRRQCRVVLRAPVSPLDTTHISNCSIGAGGFWKPSFVTDERVDDWALQTLDELWSLATANADEALVEIVPAVVLQRAPTLDLLPAWSRDMRLNFQAITTKALFDIAPDLRVPPWTELHAAGYTHCWYFSAPVVNTPRMLQHMLTELQQQSVDLDINTGRWYTSLDEMVQDAQQLGCDAVINCTGLGAREVVPDDTMRGGRGVLHVYDRATCTRRRWPHIMTGGIRDVVIRTAEPPWAPRAVEPCYLIPRGNVVVVGGTYDEDKNHGSMSETEHERLRRNARLLGIDTTVCQPLRHWVGYRPARSHICCTVEHQPPSLAGRQHNIQVAHCYGLGGSGWTINVGVAKTVVDALLQKVG